MKKIKNVTTKKEIEKNGATELVFVLDRSGSMAGLEDDTVGGFNSVIEKQRAQSGKVYVSTVLFNSESEVIHDRAEISEIKKMERKDFCVGGCTALIDALGGAIKHISSVHSYIRKEDVPEHTLFVIMTDGMENASRHFSSDEVKMLVEEKKEQGWEFLFLAANIDAAETAARYGISGDRAVEFKCDSRGVGINFASVAKAACAMRSGNGINEDWCAEIVADRESRE